MKYFQYFKTFTEVWFDGSSIVLPVVSAIKPRIPANCLICLSEPRAQNQQYDVVAIIRPESSASVSSSSVSFMFQQPFATLFLCNKTTFVLSWNAVYRILSLCNHFRFLRRYRHIWNRYGHSCSCRSTCLWTISVQYLSGLGCSVCINNFFQNLF